MGIIAPPTSTPKVTTLEASAGLGVFGHAPPGAQHAALPAPKTLLEVEAWAAEVDTVLKSYGLTA